jgi:hypothetical protein
VFSLLEAVKSRLGGKCMERSAMNNRESRGMTDMQDQIREHMMVHAQGQGLMNGVEGEHVGTVDYVEGDRIILTKNDSPDGMHHSISVDLVERIEGNTVFLNCDMETVQEEWETVEGSSEMDNTMRSSGMNS